MRETASNAPTKFSQHSYLTKTVLLILLYAVLLPTYLKKTVLLPTSA